MEFLSHFNGTITVMLFAITAYIITIPLRWTLNLLPKRARSRVQGPLGDALQIIVVLSASIFGARYAQMDITILLAIVAIFTAGVSLAMDTSVKDVIASIKLMSFGYYLVGESITIKEYTGKVVGVSLFSTTIHVSTKGLVVIANSKISESDIINHSRVPIELSVRVPVSHTHDRAVAAALLRGAISEVPGVIIGTFRVIHEWQPGLCESYTVKFKIENYDMRHDIVSAASIACSSALEQADLILGEMTYIRES